ncbi:glycosyltransferase family 4 protein [Methanosarcina sp. Z-7115]|uniref:Glycosyltransferase family 4 protein n=1 Tax=Methanosarcina baikalica TaxID=3073890 RepID=A0ABU2CZD7_9EURY|nr:glycosyltransferase family 4 protein [Methanosarcina sp. Z-7115]MDR7665101.1 glycosyltransferase family 4 protein [Methanosarcina sp. Z-7115]
MKIHPEGIRILHIGNIAGVPQNIRDGQRMFGYKSEVLSFGEDQFKYGVDISFSSHGNISRKINILYNIIKIIFQYDILHFHASSLHRMGLDLLIWKVLGKKVIMHYHGSEIRNKKQPLIQKYFADKCVVSTPDLLAFVPNSIWIPNPIDTKKYIFVEPNLQVNKLRILHAPSNKNIKGTEHVIQAIDKLKKDGYDIEFILLEKVSHDKVLKEIELSDIIVDQLILGWYGVFSIETMCMGKPTLCYIRQDLSENYPELPILNTTPKSIYVNLIELIENQEHRIELGAQGRRYVEKIHDSREVTKRLIDIYTK